MQPEQPYRPPQAGAAQRPVPGGVGTITPNMTDTLARTRPWVIFLGILGMVFCGLVALIAVFFLVSGGFPGMEEFAQFGGPVIGAVYLLMAFLYFFPSLYLLRYGGAIKRIGPRANVAAMEDALRQQLSFWRFIGILMAAVIVLYGLIIVLAAVAAIVGSRIAE